MKLRQFVQFVGPAVLACALGAGLLGAAVARAQESDIGKRTFEERCAVCHGMLGRGDGPMAGALTQSPANLTLLAQRNGGVYPFDRVYRVIDGRKEVQGHGTTTMPIWGDHFRAELSRGEPLADADIEAIVQGRILSLVFYVQTLQAR